jgi:hypothetical protein
LFKTIVFFLINFYIFLTITLNSYFSCGGLKHRQHLAGVAMAKILNVSSARLVAGPHCGKPPGICSQTNKQTVASFDKY